MGMQDACLIYYKQQSDYQMVFRSITFVFLALFGCTAFAESDPGTREHLLILDKLVDEVFYDSADTDYLQELIADNFIYVHAGASLIQSKKEAISNLPPPGVWSERKREAMDVRLHDNTAIVSGLFIAELAAFEVIKFHVLRVYVKAGPEWKLAAQHVNFDLSDDPNFMGELLPYIYENLWKKLPQPRDIDK